LTAHAVAGRPRSFQLRRRASASWRAATYLLAGLPLGFFDLLALGAAPLVGTEVLRRPLTVERSLLNSLLRARIPPLPDSLPRRATLPLAARLPGALLGLAAAAAPIAIAAAVATESIRSLAAGGDRYLGPVGLDQPAAAIALLLILPAAILCIAALESAGAISRRFARQVLARTPEGGPVREALAESLGDRTLTIAYWLPKRAVYVDEHGRPVELPEPASGRSWTAVENGGRRVAAIIHDAELEARPELVQAAATGAVLALENEQLKADLRARLEELRRSRRRIVQASVEARRRLERDLHDGAQQQLVALSLDLQDLRTRAIDEETRAVVDEAAEKLATALSELRELARGIHPAILTEHGLGPSLEALAARTPLPVELEIRLEGRLPPSVEAASYFLCAEALTNVSRYAKASYARVTLAQADGVLRVEIADDGVGGADAARGSGLRGLEDRLGALDGELSLDSPSGGGTRLVATIPLEETPA
jgi:signal transduction histidine kinase